MTSTVVGLFDTQDDAEQAVNALIARGYTNDQIGVSLRGETRAASASANDPMLANSEGNSEADQSAVAGYGAGAAVGGTLGLLLAGGSAILFPGIGLVAAAGPILAAVGGTLAGAGLGAAVGGLTGGLGDQVADGQRVDALANILQYGGVILTVETEQDQAEEVGQLLAQFGAADLTKRGQRGAIDPNEAAVREADAIDQPAVDQATDALDGTSPQSNLAAVQTPVGNAPLASDAAVAATQASGIASFKPGNQTSPDRPEVQETTVQVPTSGEGTGASRIASEQIDQVPYQRPEPYLTLDLPATADTQQHAPPNAFGEAGAHDQVVGTLAGGVPAVARDVDRGTDRYDDPPAERDLTLGDQYGGAMETPQPEDTLSASSEERDTLH